MKKIFLTLLLPTIIALNLIAQDDNEWRYVLSSTIPQGGIEVKVFNNLYTQQTGLINGDLTQRATFFTTTFNFLYGVNNRFNAGIDIKLRSVRNEILPASPFKALSFENIFLDASSTSPTTARRGITSIGPKIRFAPFRSLPKLSVQSSFLVALGDDLAGVYGVEEVKPYIDWNGATFLTQVFNDVSIGSQFSLFTEIDFLLEDIKYSNRYSTPITAIFSYFPTKEITFYGLANYSPYYFTEKYEYFYQVGLGAKYQFSPQFEIELLYNYFTNQGLQETGGKAATYNIGFRYSKQ